MGGRRLRPTGFLVATTLVGGLALTQGAFWDNWMGGNNKKDQAPAPPAPGAAAAEGAVPPLPQAPTPAPPLVPPQAPPVPAGPVVPPGLDLKGVDPSSLITPAAVGHPIPPGQCGVYTRGGSNAQIAVCVESVVEYGTDIHQMNAFLVNLGDAALCDLLIQPVVPYGATLASFWPDWALENLSEIYLDPGQVTAIGVTLRPNQADPAALPRIDIRAFKDCSHSVYDPATGDVTFKLVPLPYLMPEPAVEMEIMAADGDKAAAAAAALVASTQLQEGECAVYTKPSLGTYAQAALCVESVIRWGTQVVQVNGLLVNSGMSPLCGVRMGVEKEAQYFSMWPRWALQGHVKDNLKVGDSIAVGLTSPGRADGSFPSLFLENFDVCGHPTHDDVVRDAVGQIISPSPLEAVVVRVDDFLGRPEPKDIAKQQINTETKPVTDTSVGTKLDASGAIPDQLAIPAGTCGMYRKGAAELALCSESLVTWGKDVQQLNGFMMNTGKVAICDIKLKSALPSTSDTTYSVWPDWASKGSYELYFNPGQMTAAGMTTPPTATTPYLELASFRDCAAPAATATAPITSFSTVPVETIQPPPPAEELVSIPAVPLVAALPIIGAKEDRRLAPEETVPAAPAPVVGVTGSLPAAPAPAGESKRADAVIPQGHCAVYSVQTGTLALCVESIIHWGTEWVQVNTYLENVGQEDLCDVHVTLAGPPQGFESVWPSWVKGGMFPGTFKPGQVSPVGLVAPYNAEGPQDPAISVVYFTACGASGLLTDGEIPPVRIVPITDLKRVHVAAALIPTEVVPENKAAPIPTEVVPENKQQDAPLPPSPPTPQEGGAAVGPGRCGTASAGFFKMKLCVDNARYWSDDIVQMAGQVENLSNEPLCDLRVGHNFEKDAIATSWPNELGKAIMPGDILNFGVTAFPRGLLQGHTAPMLSVVSFRPCASVEKMTVPLPAELIWEGPLPNKVTDLLSPHGVDLGEAPQTEEGRRQLAMKNGAKPTTMDTIDWDLCGYYTGKDGQSELALCWKDAKSWKDKDAGRVVQTNLILVNTGKFGVCNVTIEIENVDQELGDHYPTNWLDEDGTDIFPTYPGYYAPEQIVNMGAAVPVASGFPEVGISADFTACSPPPPKAVAPRKADCTPVVSPDNANLVLNFCLYSKPKVWTEYDGPRVVMVEGYIENIGQETACNIVVDIENFANAQAKWGEWMPEYPYKLSPGASLKFGANIPFEKKRGIPKSRLAGFDRCDALEERLRY